LFDFEIGQIIGAHLAAASMTKTAPLLGVSRATVSKFISAYADHGKTTSAKRNSGRKSTLTERDRRKLRRIVSKNHRTTVAQVTAELYSHPKDLVSTKIIRCELHKSTVGLQLLNLYLQKIMLTCVNDGIKTIKSGHQATENARDMVR
jgi:transposase